MPLPGALHTWRTAVRTENPRRWQGEVVTRRAEEGRGGVWVKKVRQKIMNVAGTSAGSRALAGGGLGGRGGWNG